MSLITEINKFFYKYGKNFDLSTINYIKQVVHRIKTTPILDNFLTENNISASVLLNEMTPYSQYKFNEFGSEKLEMDELQSVLNIILFSNELEKMMTEDHVRFSSIGENGIIFYVADKHASDYFNDKYDIGVFEGVEFSFSIIEEQDNKNKDLDFSIN